MHGDLALDQAWLWGFHVKLLLELEDKAVVRTAAGARRYGLPIGSTIVAKRRSRAAARPPQPDVPATGSTQRPTPVVVDWDRWGKGRAVHVGTRMSGPDADRGRSVVEFYERTRAEDAEYLATTSERLTAVERQIEDRPRELREVYKVTGPALRTALAKERKPGNHLHRLGEQVQALRESVDFRKAEVGRYDRLIEAERKKLGDQSPLPEFSEDDPLAGYGDRLVIQDQTGPAALHLHELESYVPIEAHHALRDYYAGMDGGGIYVGDRAIPDLDELGTLRNTQPRGWGEGSTWAEVPGAHWGERRVTAMGGGGHGHGSTSLALHEGGHALDSAIGSALGGGTASQTPEFRAVHDLLGKTGLAKPYYRADANPDGFLSESWAEGFAAWSRHRKGDPALAVADALGLIGATVEDRQAVGRAFATYYADLLARLKR